MRPPDSRRGWPLAEPPSNVAEDDGNAISVLDRIDVPADLHPEPGEMASCVGCGVPALVTLGSTAVELTGREPWCDDCWLKIIETIEELSCPA